MNTLTENLVSDPETEFWNTIDEEEVQRQISELPEEYRDASYFTTLDYPKEHEIKRLTPKGFVTTEDKFFTFDQVWETLPF